MNSQGELRQLVICGRVFGTYISWEGELDEVIFVDYVPSDQARFFGLVEGDMTFDMVKGLLVYHDDSGNEIKKFDAVPIMGRLPRKVGL